MWSMCLSAFASIKLPHVIVCIVWALLMIMTLLIILLVFIMQRRSPPHGCGRELSFA